MWDCTLIKLMKEKGSTVVNPIYDWLDTDIWEFIRREQIRVNPLYAKGYDRVGCIGCPLAPYKQRKKEFQDYPKFKKMYIQAYDKMLEYRREKGKPAKWANGEEVFDWWIEENKYNVKGQMSLFEEEHR